MRPRQQRHDEVDDEVRVHLELRVEQLMREGLDEAEAQREARRRFASSGRSLNAVYDAARQRDRAHRFGAAARALGHDARHAWRRLRREPVMTAFMLAILALGFGANLAAFGLADRLLLRGPAHVADADSLVRIYRRLTLSNVGDQTAPWIPWSTFEMLRVATGNSLPGLSAYRKDVMTVGRGADARRRTVGRSTDDLFATLGVQPHAGRFFTEADQASGSPVAVISHALATNAADAEALGPGDAVVIGETTHTIVGVAPPAFTGPDLRRTDVWIPIDRSTARSLNWQIVGRRVEGVSTHAATEDVDAAHRANPDASPSWLRDGVLLAAPIGYGETGQPTVEAIMVRWLLIVSATVLLIACANITGLLVARLVRHEREMAIHAALGAGRGRLARVFLIEGLSLSLIASVLGMAIAGVFEPLVRGALVPDAMPSFAPGDARTLGVALVGAFGAGALLALVPALQAGAARLPRALQRGGRGSSTPRTGLRSALTVAQAALTVVLLIGAGLFLRSLQQVTSVDLGFDPHAVVAVDVEYPSASAALSDVARLVERARFRHLLDVVRQMPGVADASLSMGLPFAGSFGQDLHIDGKVAPALPGGGPHFQVVGPDYFSTMGTRIIAGRAFTADDREGTEPVIIVSALTASTFWPNADPLGGCVRIGAEDAPCTRVVGVAADIHRSGLREEPSLQYYLPIGQETGISGTALVVRSAGRPGAIVPALRQALTGADTSVRSVDARILADALDVELRPLRVGAVLFGVSGGMALLVAGLGLYGLMAYLVAGRRREIGVRLALGATPGQVRRLVASHALGLAGTGVMLGALLAWTARGTIQRELFETSASDPVVFVGVAAGVTLVALASAWWPGRRAARTSPSVALSVE